MSVRRSILLGMAGPRGVACQSAEQMHDDRTLGLVHDVDADHPFPDPKIISQVARDARAALAAAQAKQAKKVGKAHAERKAALERSSDPCGPRVCAWGLHARRLSISLAPSAVGPV